MKQILKSTVIAPTLLIGFMGGANAATFTITDSNSVTRFISADGTTVTELKPISGLSSSSFNTLSFNNSYGGQFSGYTVNTTDSNDDQIAISTYNAGSRGAAANGLPVVGGQIIATYQNNFLPIGTPNFVQFIETNQPLGGATPPYLDPVPNDDNLPFYYTEAERTRFQLGNNLSFVDFSSRTTDALFGTSPALNSIIWESDLFYVQWDGGTEITVEGGINWGWETKSATKGNSTASFINPGSSTAVFSGVGTNAFAWGSGQSSQLSFTPKPFNPKPNEVFAIGTLDFFNGSIVSGTGLSSVDLLLDLTFDNATENNQQTIAGLSLINTPNTSDPVASADFVSFSSGGFNSTFNVLEGESASADIFARFVSVTVTPSVGPSNSDKSFASPLDVPAISGLGIEILGFGNSSENGFIEGDDFSGGNLPKPVPEPSSIWSLIAVLIFMALSWKFGKRRL